MCEKYKRGAWAQSELIHMKSGRMKKEGGSYKGYMQYPGSTRSMCSASTVQAVQGVQGKQGKQGMQEKGGREQGEGKCMVINAPEE